MPKPRKTIAITELVTCANRLLAVEDRSPESRHAIIHLLETVLHDTNNYFGYGYIGGYVIGMDETKRQYYGGVMVANTKPVGTTAS